MPVSLKIPTIGDYKERIVIVKRSNFGYFEANKGGMCHTEFSDRII